MFGRGQSTTGRKRVDAFSTRLYRAPSQAEKSDPNSDNIFSWVHKEFKTTDIKASKHRLLCKLDDMSHGKKRVVNKQDPSIRCLLARTIRSVSCHNFLDSQRVDSFKRSSTDQHVHSGKTTTNSPSSHKISHGKSVRNSGTMFCSFLEPMRNGRMSSPLRAINPLFGEHANPQSISITSPLSLGHSVPLTNGSTHFTTQSVGISLDRSPEINKEREKQPMDYTDLEGNISI